MNTFGFYDIREIRVPASDLYSAPAGYLVDSTEDVVDTKTTKSTSSADIATDRRSVTVSGVAVGSGEFRNTAGDAANETALVSAGTTFGGPLGTLGGLIAGAAGADIFPDAQKISIGSFQRRVKVNLVSEAPTKKTGEQYVLLVTSRSLCCCPTHKKKPGAHDDSKIIGIQPVDAPPPLEVESVPGPPPVEGRSMRTSGNVMNARTANQLGEMVNDLTKQISTSVGNVAEHPGLDRAYVLGRLARVAITSDSGLFAASDPAGTAAMGRDNLRRVAHALGKDATEVNRFDLLSMPAEALRGVTGMSDREILHVHLDAMGLPTKPVETSSDAGPPTKEALR